MGKNTEGNKMGELSVKKVNTKIEIHFSLSEKWKMFSSMLLPIHLTFNFVQVLKADTQLMTKTFSKFKEKKKN